MNAIPVDQTLPFLRRIVQECSKIIKAGSAIQEPQRQKLAKELQNICTDCQKSYETFVAQLAPIKKAYEDGPALVKQLQKFSSRPEYRSNFKPDKLCGNVAQLLTRLSSKLDPLIYSVALGRIKSLQQELENFQNYDQEFYRVFDEFATVLGRDAADLQTLLSSGESATKIKKLRSQIRKRVETLEDEVSKTLRKVTEAHKRVAF